MNAPASPAPPVPTMGVVAEYIAARDAYEDATRPTNSHGHPRSLKHGDPVLLRYRAARAALAADPSPGVVDETMVERIEAVRQEAIRAWEKEVGVLVSMNRQEACRVGMRAALQAAALPAAATVEGLRQGNWHHPDGGRIVGWVIEPDDVERLKADAFCLPREVGDALGALRKAAQPAVPEVESVTLTVAQIADLARFAGLTLTQSSQPAPDELEAEITVCECPGKGVLLDGEEADPGAVAHYQHIAYYSEYPDEGCIGLGAELAATPAHDQPAEPA